MKNITKLTAMIMIIAMLAAVCLAGCGGGKAPAETTAAQGGSESVKETEAATEAPTEAATEAPTGAPEITPEPETEAAVSMQTYTITNDGDGVTMTVEVPEIDGIAVNELNDRSGIRIVYDEAGWQLELVVSTVNAEALAKKIDGGEALTYGDNKSSLEFSSWAAKGQFDFGKVPDTALAVAIEFDLRPSDTYQPDGEDELRGYLEDEYVGMIFAAMHAEADSAS